MKLFASIIGAITLCCATALATPNTPIEKMPAGTYELDPTHASITFKVSHIGLSNYTARFTKFDATIELDPKNPHNSSVKAVIDPLSIKTDYPYPEKKDFDKKLSTNEEWLNANQFKDITFESTHIEGTLPNGKLHGNLTMLGVTKPVTLDVHFNGAYDNKPFVGLPALGFSATTTIKRSQWGFDVYVPNIGDDVQIALELEFHQKLN